MTANLRVGFIGAGKMATALAKGFLEGGVIKKPSQILASCPIRDKHLLEQVKQLGCETMHCNQTVTKESDVLILAVKPQIMQVVLTELKSDIISKNNLVVSIAAGVTLAQIEQGICEESRIVRLMPNTPCIVREGASVYCLSTGATQDDGKIVKNLFSSVGTCDEVAENMIDAVTGISGSGPAYMYIILEAMADGGVKMGLPRNIAYQLAAQTMIGAGMMVRETKQHPAILKDEVCSPGGTTITALDILEKSGLRTAMMQAVEAAATKCVQLSEKS